MIEIREDGSIPGPVKFGRIYKIVDLDTGEVGYNYTASDLPGLDPYWVTIIEEYDTFLGWQTEILPVKEVSDLVKKLNSAPFEYIKTPHVLLVERINKRIHDNDIGLIDGHDIISDMKSMREDILGRHVRPPLPGWK